MIRKSGFAYRGVYDEKGECFGFEELPRDANGFTIERICGFDEYRLLSECGMTADTGIRLGLFTYQNCPGILFERGWVTEHGLMTEAGYKALAAGRATS